MRPHEGVSLRAVLFDLDGTLIASDAVWDQAITELAAAHGGQLPPDYFVRCVGLTAADAIVIAHEMLGLSTEQLDANLRWLHDRVRLLLGDAPPPWFNGARELVRAVRAAGLFTGLVTSSGRDHVDAAIVEVDRARFDVIVSGDDVLAPKPSPEPYLRAAAALGVDPGECAVVEDSTIGVTSALAAGCRVVAVCPSHGMRSAGGYLVVASLTEIDLNLLGSLQHGGSVTTQR